MRRPVNNRFRLYIICVLLWTAGPASLCMGSSRANELQRKAKRYVLNRQWEKAIDMYEQVAAENNQNNYQDDAKFWIGFCQEQLPGNEASAFEKYQNLVDTYPASPWKDDAIVHQIHLAKILYSNDSSRYGQFLRRQLNSDDPKIRDQAALVLGQLKNPEALPVLEKMARGDDEALAGQAWDLLRDYGPYIEEQVNEDTIPWNNGEETESDSDPDSNIVYQQLFDETGIWGDEKIMLNGLFHIVTRKDLMFYLSLKREWDRKEWLRKFWAALDPTPTTVVNEAEAAFQERVRFARANFPKNWHFRRNYYPPWDSRGELYIKFGEPDKREIYGDGWEDWTYQKLRMTFRVADYIPNRSGEGIHLNPVSRYLYRHSLRYQRTHYLQRPQFVYLNQEMEQSQEIKNMVFRLDKAERTGPTVQTLFRFSFDAKNLRYNTEGNVYAGAFRRKWVLFDEDYNRLREDDIIDEVKFMKREDIRESEINGQIRLNLVPGIYLLALRIEDMNSNRLGIFRKKFTIKPKGNVSELSNESSETNNK